MVQNGLREPGQHRRTSSVLLDLRKNSASTAQFSLLIDRFRRHSETIPLPWLPTRALHRAVMSWREAEHKMRANKRGGETMGAACR